MHSKTRYSIKLSQRHDITIKAVPLTPESADHDIKTTAQLIALTADRHKYKSHGQRYYEQIFNFFKNLPANASCKITLYQAWYKEELLAAAAMIDFGTTRTYLFGGSSMLHREAMPSYSLHWKAIQDAKTLGLTQYDWWGIETAGGQTPGFVRFKVNWGGQSRSYPEPWDIVQRPLWYNAYNVFRALNRLI